MNNYEFCDRFAREKIGVELGRVLDYGCGRGSIVELLRNQEIEAYGCDVFYEGGDYSSQVEEDNWSHGHIRRMENDTIPFPDETFDVIINNQVIEHVPDLDRMLAEIYRVLKPGGAVLSLFPHRWAIYEGHCGVPLLHWFPRRSWIRVLWAFGWRLLGLGYFREGKSAWSWSRDFCEWLDRWTHYRSYHVIKVHFAKRFAAMEHYEDVWLHWCHLHRRPWLRWIPSWLHQLMVRRMCGLIFVVRKHKSAPRVDNNDHSAG
jgi:SAM-dependent methyltransferase